MPRKRKNLESDSENSRVEEEIETSEPIEEDIDNQEESGSLIDRARGILNKGINTAQDKLKPDAPAKKKWVSPEKRKAQEASVASLLTSLFVMIVVSWQAPDELKPNEDELTAVSGFSTSILLRHVNISGRLTQDVMDGIGIVAVIASYLSRTAEARRNYALSRSESEPAVIEERHDEPIYPNPEPSL